MRIDRAAFLALALGAGFSVTACGTTRKATDPQNQNDGPTAENWEMDEEGFTEEGPTAECIAFDDEGTCTAWEGEMPEFTGE